MIKKKIIIIIIEKSIEHCLIIRENKNNLDKKAKLSVSFKDIPIMPDEIWLGT